MNQAGQNVGGRDLTIELREADSGYVARLKGRIDERALLVGLAGRVRESLVMDLGGVVFINSVGVREWIKMMRQLAERGVRVRFDHCPEPLVQQMNMIVEARGRAQVTSFYAPYQCIECGYEGSMCIDVSRHREQLRAREAPAMSCPECAGAMELSEIPERYFLFLEEP